MEYIENEQLKLANNFVQNTGRNIFLTGKAGTGKTTFLKNIKNTTNKRHIIVAPTGVAAINASGVTIHSFFQLPFGPIIPAEKSTDGNWLFKSPATRDVYVQKFSKAKINIMRSLDLLIIDEISMVRADVLDGIDVILRRIRRSSQPFGGVQLLMIGDMQQLAPVVKDDEWDILREYYENCFFFSSIAVQKTSYVSIELKDIFRQTDITFINILNKIRDNKVNIDDLNIINKRYTPQINEVNTNGYITLTTHNYQSQKINTKELAKIKDKAKYFEAKIDGDFPEYIYPTNAKLELKKGAQVMFIRNDSSVEKLFFNGKIGKIVAFDEDKIVVKCKDDNFTINVTPDKWENIRYDINQETKEISEKIIGTFVQYPLKLAWAITIHKSQGLTFDNAIIDAQSAFAFGQVYVALSRCRTLEGLILSSPINSNCIKTDVAITEFNNSIVENEPDKNQLINAMQDYKLQLILELFDFEYIRKMFFYTKNIIVENSAGIPANTITNFNKYEVSFTNDIFLVSFKFINNIKNNLLNNKYLTEDKIKNACNYFYEKLKINFDNYLHNLSIHSDNKEVKKKLQNHFEELFKQLIVKSTCFKECSTGFEISKYLNIKAKAILDEEVLIDSLKSKAKTFSNENILNPELFNILIEWRQKTANRLNKSLSGVISIKNIEELSNQLPTNFKELSKINRFGKAKTNNYGLEVLGIIRNYCKEKNIKSEFDKISQKDAKTIVVGTEQVTLELYNSNKSLEEIAKIRNLSVRTIEGHISHLIASGHVDITKLMDEQQIKLIFNYFSNADNHRLTSAIEQLGADVKFSELHFVLSHMKYKGLIKEMKEN